VDIPGSSLMESSRVGSKSAEAPAALAVRLRGWRERRGWTQEELAVAARGRLTSRTIRNIERGRTHPYLYTLITLLDALEVPPEDRAALLELWRSVPASGRSSTFTDQALPAPGFAFQSNLPVPLTPLIGRDSQQSLVEAMLRRGVDGVSVRLLTLTGPGGVGKTRLALEIASALLEEFVDGVAFVSLAPLDDPDMVMPAVASTLGWDDSGDVHPGAWLAEQLHKCRVLLVLDNCEQVLAAAPELVELLETCPRLVILATSRSPLRLRGEQVFLIPPLALPTGAAERDLAMLGHVPSVALFVRRVRAAQASFQLTTANAPTVAAICRRLDGLPLALELAAARLVVLSAAGLLAQLEHRLAVLVNGARDLPPRQQTLRATLTWSHDLLSAAERTVLRRLSVFKGGWTLRAAEAVCSSYPGAGLEYGKDRGTCVPALSCVLQSLVEHSLVMLETAPEFGVDEPRYAFLETVREYGLELLVDAGEEADSRRAHALFYADFVEQATPWLMEGGRDPWLRRLDRELENLRAALDWCQAERQPSTLLRLVGGMIWYWYFRGYLGAGYRRLELALACAEAVGPNHYPEPWARALWGAGRLAHLLGDEVRAAKLLGESVARWREVGDQRGLAYALTDLGQVAFFQGEIGTARIYTDEGVARFHSAADRWGLALALQHLGRVVLAEGDENEAASLYREVLAIYDELGDPWGRGMPLLGLGRVALARERFAEARRYLEDGLTVFQHTGERRMSAMALSRLGQLARKEGDDLRAAACYQQSIVLRHELGQFMSIGMSLTALAALAGRRGEVERAARLGGAAEALLEQRGRQQSPRDREDHQRLMTTVRGQMEVARLAALWEEGRMLRREQVLALALTP
jgi:predicted ATPase/transcriptional regulator with XRE-family HTH domain